jgi:hypothetical protein
MYAPVFAANNQVPLFESSGLTKKYQGKLFC